MYHEHCRVLLNSNQKTCHGSVQLLHEYLVRLYSSHVHVLEYLFIVRLNPWPTSSFLFSATPPRAKTSLRSNSVCLPACLPLSLTRMAGIHDMYAESAGESLFEEKPGPGLSGEGGGAGGRENTRIHVYKHSEV